MIFHQINSQTGKRMTFLNKVSLFLWIGATLALLSFFTFTFFVIALLVGLVIFTLRFFRQSKQQPINNQYTKGEPFVKQNHSPRSPREDDIIDI